ncbi:MAG: cyclic nucleotide-binding and patatin-like phospholipase domain-containing protein [Acidimicrobiia bacterium]|nr:cyclic nucleotide-binding and patatin-like phospholipase domain-containing protein [Acidimicrobiia bacterium]
MGQRRSREANLKLISTIPLFSALSEATLKELVDCSSDRRLVGGEILMREGEAGDSMFVVVNGRLRADVLAGDGSSTVVGEISAGETVGEMALLSDHPRSATVRAVRDSNLIELSREVFHDLVSREPAALAAIARMIVARLGRSIHSGGRSGEVRIVALVAAGQTRDIMQAAGLLEDALSKHGTVAVVDSNRFELVANGQQSMDLGRMVEELGAAHDKVLLITDHASPEWTRRCIGQADRVLLIGEPSGDPWPNSVEEGLLHEMATRAHTRVDLVMVHGADGPIPAPVSSWIEHRPGIRHYNLRPGTDAGFQRLARILTGTAVNLVLSGGGARGLAQIGVLRALEESGVPIDFVGGASFGSITAAHKAMGRGWEETREQMVKHLVDLGSPVDLTPPLVALARGAKVRHQLRGTFGEVNIEDLWIRFFCVSSNLTRGEVQVHQTGALWEALRASISIPGVFPPMRSQDGDVLVDGAVMNNLPVDVAETLGEPGPILAVNLRSPADIAAHDLPRDGALSGWRALRHHFAPWRKKSAVPGMVQTLLRTSEIGSVISSKVFEQRADLVFRPPVSDFSLMAFASYEQLIEVGYRHALQVLEQNEASERLTESILSH